MKDLKKYFDKQFFIVLTPILILTLVNVTLFFNYPHSDSEAAAKASSKGDYESMLPIFDKADEYFSKMKSGDMKVGGWLANGSEDQQARQVAERAYFKYLLMKEMASGHMNVDLEQLEQEDVYTIIGTVYP